MPTPKRKDPERLQLNIRIGDEEMQALREAAADAGMTPSEWARIVLRVATGRYELTEQLQRGADAGRAAIRAAVGGVPRAERVDGARRKGYAGIRDTRAAAFDALEGPRVGDFVVFACGTVHRFSYKWDDGIQTSREGSWYLGNGYVSFSGGLQPSVKFDTLTLTEEKRDGRFWFFHHDFAEAHRGVDCTIPCQVWRCSLTADWWKTKK